MKLKLLIYRVTWIFVKYATFAKDWDIGTISITALAIMIWGMLLFEFGKSLLFSGRTGLHIQSSWYRKS
ncbi:hypothetical protein [Ectobacillus funiculus]|uniref:Uncharacterized protein n=1 Tax=Ectobacillus funiculus TaxID=137993 RepID=A0ABV5WPB5_9BACI